MADNYLWLAEEKGMGIAGLNQIEVLGSPLDIAIYPYTT
jgi:hypothetical protein